MINIDRLIADFEDCIGKWKYRGVPAAADMPEEDDAMPMLPVDAMLRRGDRDEGVKELQRALRSVGYDLEIDGIFGRITLECVKSFQVSHDLTRDGVVGALTWASLQKACEGVADSEVCHGLTSSRDCLLSPSVATTARSTGVDDSEVCHGLTSSRDCLLSPSVATTARSTGVAEE